MGEPNTEGIDGDLSDGNTLQADTPEELVVDGKTYTPDEITRMVNRDKNLQRDYTEKTTELAKDREALNVESTRVNSMMDKAVKAQNAFHADVDHFKTHTIEESANYVPQVDMILGNAKDTTPNVSQEIDIENHPLVKSLQKDITDIKAKNAQDDNLKLDKSFDDALKFANSVIVKDYQSASSRDVHNQISVYYVANGKIPSEQDIRKFASVRHEENMKMLKSAGGSTENLTNVENQDPGMPSSKGSGIVDESKDEVADLYDINAAEENGKAYFDNLRKQREGV